MCRIMCRTASQSPLSDGSDDPPGYDPGLPDERTVIAGPHLPSGCSRRPWLAVGNQTLDRPELAEAIWERIASGPAKFHIVVPATPVQRGLTWDEDEARIAAQDRLTAAFGRMVEMGGQVSV